MADPWQGISDLNSFPKCLGHLHSFPRVAITKYHKLVFLLILFSLLIRIGSSMRFFLSTFLIVSFDEQRFSVLVKYSKSIFSTMVIVLRVLKKPLVTPKS